MIDWILDNETCIFTALGVLMTTTVFSTLFIRKKRAAAQAVSDTPLHTETGSEPADPDYSGSSTYPSYRTETKNGIKIIYKYDPATDTETIVNTNLN